MDPSPNLPSWRIVSVPGGDFSWSPAEGDGQPQLSKPRRILIPRRGTSNAPRNPSLADLLYHAPPELLGGGNCREDCGAPMFRTGSGRSVSVKQSSVLTAACVIGDAEGPGSMFKTGSGKSISLRESSEQKAALVLAESNKIERGCKAPSEGDALDEDLPMFSTGSGKAVSVKKSSIRKAACMLKDESGGKGVMGKHGQSSTFNIPSFLLREGPQALNVSSVGVRKATALLGLNRNHAPIVQCTDHTIALAGNSIVNIVENSSMDSYPKARFINPVAVGSAPGNSFPCLSGKCLSSDNTEKATCQSLSASGMHMSPVPSPFKFHTAGGRIMSVSNDALQRARKLLGDLDSEVTQNDITANYHTYYGKMNKENFHLLGSELVTSRVPSVGSRCATELPVADRKATISSWNHMKKDDSASKHFHKSNGGTSLMHMQSKKEFRSNNTTEYLSEETERSRGRPLVDISNKMGSDIPSQVHLSGQTKGHMAERSTPPFKRPRTFRFSAPLRDNISSSYTGQAVLSTSKRDHSMVKVSTRFPFKAKRKSMLEFFGGFLIHQNVLIQLSDEVRHMNVGKAANYIFPLPSSLRGIGVVNFQEMLIQCGASSPSLTKEWVRNHYKWIVWKLACLERNCPYQAKGNYLTVVNVLEELKYRYEREVNHGHRSAVKKILEGDASPASMVVLCISAIHAVSNKSCKVDMANVQCEDARELRCHDGSKRSHMIKIELTDGWYSLDSTLDGELLKHLEAGKLFVGQKLRIWGATLCGWVGPISPLEDCKTVSLHLHINGTYRAHWAERLGFCKCFKCPLAFKCVKAFGGPIPKTLVGITRVYPILYKERFPDGGSIVRSEKMECKMQHIYNHRRFLIAEDVMSEQEKDLMENDNDSEEGAKIFKILETSAEPELLMADMTSEQLMSFSNYQTKQKAIKQDNVQKKIEKAMKDAGLSSREVSRFMRIRVVGLTGKSSPRKGSPRHGLVTIWNPTEKQNFDLVEGQMYCVSGLLPLNGGPNILYLQARGHTSIWKPLSPIECEKFEPFFSPRHPVLLSTLGEVPLASEFDIAATILYIGDVYVAGHQKKQWVFVTDGSQSSSELLEGAYNCLLAVGFCLPVIDEDMSTLINSTLLGSTVCFYNLVKKACDQLCNLWVAEATENSTYSLADNLPINSHLKKAANRVKKWTGDNSSVLQKLRDKVFHIVGSC